MGVFDFIKSVGEKIGITSEDESPKAEDLKAEVAKHGLDAENLEVSVDGGDTVKVAGATESSSIREKNHFGSWEHPRNFQSRGGNRG